MHRLFFDSQRRLRNGWWILAFVALLVVSRFAYQPVSKALQSLGASSEWLGPLPVMFLLVVTWCCTRLRREPLASVGLQLDRRWWRQLAAGLGVGVASMLAIALCIRLVGGVRFELSGTAAWSALATGFYVFAFAALLEELLARGFVFQRLVDGTGMVVAQLLMAAAFALAHGDNPNMDAANRAWAMLDIALGSLIYGLAWWRTRSLALPFGMHFGWNWMQGSVLGFGVSGYATPGWLRAVPTDSREWLTGGAFGPEASAFAVMIDLIVLVGLWQWHAAPRPARAQPPAIVSAAAVGPANV